MSYIERGTEEATERVIDAWLLQPCGHNAEVKVLPNDSED